MLVLFIMPRFCRLKIKALTLGLCLWLGLGLCLALWLVLLSGCTEGPLEELSRQELFSLKIGKMDNQIDLFQIGGELFNHKNRLYMRGGLFYIANGNSAKVMEFTSYGDLIFLLYNPQSNPHPVSLSGSIEKGQDATRKAVPYPLRAIGELAVDSEKRIYLEDKVSEERQVKDKDQGVILNRVVLRFDRHGTLLDFIGQEGVGGTPFPYIISIHISETDELTVVCRTTQAWLVFWYDSQGHLLYQVRIDQEHLPRPDVESLRGGRPGTGSRNSTVNQAAESTNGTQQEVIPFVATVVPDLEDHLLYLHLHYYLDTIDGTTGITATVKNAASRIYTLDLDTGKYTSYLEVFQDSRRKEMVGIQEAISPLETIAPSYELLGVSAGKAFFLLRREDANLFRLHILDRDGKRVAKRYLVMEDSELFFKELSLSPSGIIYALLGEEYEAKLVWWRSDKLLRDDVNETR